MEYKESVKATIKYTGKWNAQHLVKELTYREIFGLALNKLFNKGVSLEHTQGQLLNALLDEGELDILNVYFRNTSAPTNFYFGLGNGSVPAETATLATITEVTGTGYARQLVARNTSDWGAPALDSGDYQTTSTTENFNATGTWTQADYMFLTDVVSGTGGPLIAVVALGTPRTLVNGDSLAVDLTVKLQ